MNLSRHELIDLIRRVTTADYKTEEEGDLLLEQIKASVPHPRVSNVLFYSRAPKTSEEMADELLSYKPVVLGPSSDHSNG